MTVKVVQSESRVCDCGSGLLPGLYPDHNFSEPDEKGESFVTGVIPAWFCPNCGEHTLLKKEDMNNWLFAFMRFQSHTVGAINVTEKLAGLCPKFQAMLEEQGHTCNGCGECDFEDGEEDGTEQPQKRNLH